MPSARCIGIAESQLSAVMRKRRQKNNTRGVRTAQMYQSLEAARNSCQKLSGRPRATAKTYACTEKVTTMSVHAAKIRAHCRKRRVRLVRVKGIGQLWRNHTPRLFVSWP